MPRIPAAVKPIVFAYAELPSDREARRMVLELSGATVAGHPITVQWARDFSIRSEQQPPAHQTQPTATDIASTQTDVVADSRQISVHDTPFEVQHEDLRAFFAPLRV